MSEPTSALNRPFTSYFPEHFPTSFEEVKSAVYNLAAGIADLAQRVAAFAVSCFQDLQEYCLASRQASGSQDPVFENRGTANLLPRHNAEGPLEDFKVDKTPRSTPPPEESDEEDNDSDHLLSSSPPFLTKIPEDTTSLVLSQVSFQLTENAIVNKKSNNFITDSDSDDDSFQIEELSVDKDGSTIPISVSVDSTLEQGIDAPPTPSTSLQELIETLVDSSSGDSDAEFDFETFLLTPKSPPEEHEIEATTDLEPLLALNTIDSHLERQIDAMLTPLQQIMTQTYEPRFKEVKLPIVTWIKDETPEAKLERIDTLKRYDRRLYKNDSETSGKLVEEQRICYHQGTQEPDNANWKPCNLPKSACVLEGRRGHHGEQPFKDELSETSSRTSSGYSYSVLGAEGRRVGMEDTHVADSMTISFDGEVKTVSYFGVFDGHGGSECSEFVAKELSSTLTVNLEKYWNKDGYLTGIANALKMTCVDLNDTYNDQVKEKGSYSGIGTTAVIAVVIDGYLWIANVGDSRALLVLPEKTVRLSDDAQPVIGNGRFDQSITRRAGRIYNNRVAHPNEGYPERFYNIAVARDFGESFYEGCLTARPKVLCVKQSSLPSGTKLGLVCDGITNVASTNQIGASIRAGATAASLVESAFKSGSGDNLTAMVIDLGGVATSAVQ